MACRWRIRPIATVSATTRPPPVEAVAGTGKTTALVGLHEAALASGRARPPAWPRHLTDAAGKEALGCATPSSAGVTSPVARSGTDALEEACRSSRRRAWHDPPLCGALRERPVEARVDPVPGRPDDAARRLFARVFDAGSRRSLARSRVRRALGLQVRVAAAGRAANPPPARRLGPRPVARLSDRVAPRGLRS